MSTPEGGSGASLTWTLALNSAIFLLTVLTFGSCRRCYARVFSPRWTHLNAKPTSPYAAFLARDPSISRHATPPLPDGLVDLVRAVALPSSIARAVGLDAYVFLFLLKGAGTLAAAYGGLCLLILAPLAATAHTAPVDAFDRTSIAHIEEGSPRLWAYAAMMYVLTAACMAAVLLAYKHVLPMRYAWLAIPQPSRFTVLFSDLPETVMTDAGLYRLASSLYPGQVHSVCIATSCGDLEELATSRNARVREASRLLGRLANVRSTQPGPDGPDALRLRAALAKLQAEISHDDLKLWTGRHTGTVSEDARAAALRASVTQSPLGHATAAVCDRPGEVAHARVRARGLYCPLPAGFVTFNSLATATIASQVLPSARTLGKMLQLAIRRAPEPRDIIWKNVGVLRGEKAVRGRIAGLLAVGLVLVLVPLSSAISSLAIPATEVLTTWGPFSLLAGWVPSIALSLVLLLIPFAMRLLAALACKTSHSEATAAILRWTFLYDIFATLLVFTLAGTVYAILRAIVDVSPLSVAAVLASALPGLASFFSQFLLTQALVVLPLAHLRLWPLAMHALLRAWNAGSNWTAEDEVELDLWVAGTFAYEDELSSALTAFVILVIFAPINPLIVPAAVLFYVVASCCHAYSLLYVSAKNFESGAAWLPLVLSRVLIGLVIAQLTMAGLLGLKGSVGAASVTFPLPIFTYIFHAWIDRTYAVDVHNLPLDAARNPNLLLRPAVPSHGGHPFAPPTHHGRLQRAWAALCSRLVGPDRTSPSVVTSPLLPSPTSAGTGLEEAASLLGAPHSPASPTSTPPPASSPAFEPALAGALMRMGARGRAGLRAWAHRARVAIRERHDASAVQAGAAFMREALREEEEEEMEVTIAVSPAITDVSGPLDSPIVGRRAREGTALTGVSLTLGGVWASAGEVEDARRPPRHHRFLSEQPSRQRTGISTGEAGLDRVGAVDEEHKWAYVATRSVYLRPCLRPAFDAQSGGGAACTPPFRRRGS